jgi:hypothetical protein
MSDALRTDEHPLSRCSQRIGFNETELENWWTKKKLRSEKSGYFNKELYALIQKVKFYCSDEA